MINISMWRQRKTKKEISLLILREMPSVDNSSKTHRKVLGSQIQFPGVIALRNNKYITVYISIAHR